MPITLTGEVKRVTFENEETSFRVLRIGEVSGPPGVPSMLSVVGVFGPVGPGTRIRVTGELVTDPRHGEQIKAEALVPLDPGTQAGLEKYLGSGLIYGIGPALAKRIVARFGMETLTVLDESPHRLKEVSGIGARRVDDIRTAWREHREVSNIMVLLQSHGASPALAARIYKRYGERAASIVQRSPYRLALEVHGVGFKTADHIARSLGIAGDHPERVQAGVLHVLESLADKGHLYAPRAALAEQTAEMLEVGVDHVQAAIDSQFAAERVVVEGDDVFLARLHRAELAVAQGFARLLEAPSQQLVGLDAALNAFERSAGVSLAPEQRRAVQLAAERKVVVITGGPGVGKTTIVRAIVSVFEASRLALRLAAPTGRAAKRLAESTGREASTLHRLLEFEPRTGKFLRDADNPIAAQGLIVDEASMVDVPLAQALLEALPTEARLVIVGDSDQLPSVGPGAFLRDVIDSKKIATVRLVEIFRQARESGIVMGAHRILAGEPPEGARSDAPGADFFIVPRRDPVEAAQVVEELVCRRIPRRFGFSAVEDVQVLTPMHRGPAGTTALNQRLQQKLSRSGPSLKLGERQFFVGDKVMQVRNDYERDVFNGDLGRIVAIDAEARRVEVSFDGKREKYEGNELDALVLAYATSIHKSQGSEYPAVVIPLLTVHFVMLSRNLLYTAVTRARKLCVLVADPRAVALALSELKRDDRLTRLSERLRATT